MDKFSYEIGRFSGILEGFSYVNNKTNHGFSFEIKILDSENSIESSAERYLKNMYSDAEISFDSLKSWESMLTSYIEKWLFCYQPHNDLKNNEINGGCGSYFSFLKDTDESFSLFNASFRKDFISDLCSIIESNLKIIRGVEVKLKTENWYECDWNDIALEGENGNIFIHLGVSD